MQKRGKMTSSKRAKMKSMKTSLFCCVLVMYHGKNDLSNKIRTKYVQNETFFLFLYNPEELGGVEIGLRRGPTDGDFSIP